MYTLITIKMSPNIAKLGFGCKPGPIRRDRGHSGFMAHELNR